MLDDMGHDLPEPLWPEIITAIVKFGDSADAHISSNT
jgi:hypothetical protein